jgi:RNA polymerase sigma-70 factor, ECF subfamily
MVPKHALSGLAIEEAVYRRHAPQVLAYLLRHMPSQEDAEDLLLDIFLAVWEKLSTLDRTEQQLGAYLRTVARNKMADYYRQRGKYQMVPLEEIAETAYEREELAPEQRALTREQYTQLHQAVSSLPEQHQAILYLRFGYGLRCGEIAKRLAKNESAVRMMLSRSLKLLRNSNPIYKER